MTPDRSPGSGAAIANGPNWDENVLPHGQCGAMEEPPAQESRCPVLRGVGLESHIVSWSTPSPAAPSSVSSAMALPSSSRSGKPLRFSERRIPKCKFLCSRKLASMVKR